MIPSVYTCWKTLNDPSKHRFPHTLVEWAVEEEVGTILNIMKAKDTRKIMRIIQDTSMIKSSSR
jgi:hypothetical protein